MVLFIFNGATADDSEDSGRYLLAQQLPLQQEDTGSAFTIKVVFMGFKLVNSILPQAGTNFRGPKLTK